MDLLQKLVGLPSTSVNEPIAGATTSNVGILGFELYFPKNYVCQTELEQFDQVSSGKYSAGLGQSMMSFCDDTEDINSLALSVTSALLHNYKIDPKSIGFLEVGTETLIDKSKSVKTVLMDLFGEKHTDIQGADVKNACFGGTQALFHSIDWIYANYELEERLAIVVCVDIAVYSPGPARCTGGAGAIAFLVGPQAPLVLERGLRSVFASNVYDFYKPVAGQSSEYALVNGQKSVELYLSAVDNTYEVYRQKCLRILGQNRSVADFYAVLFHCPFTKLVQKAFGRLVFRDYERNENYTKSLESEKVEKYRISFIDWTRRPNDAGTRLKVVEWARKYGSDSAAKKLKVNSQLVKEWMKENWGLAVSLEETLSREFSTATMQLSQPLMVDKLNAHLEFNKQLGNMYTPSVYAQLVNLVYNNPIPDQQLNDQKVLVFSYGSGCIAAMYSIAINTSSVQQQHSYQQIVGSAQRAHRRLHQRFKQSPQQFTQALESRERLIASEGVYSPRSAHQNYFPGTYCLSGIDEKARRSYSQVDK